MDLSKLDEMIASRSQRIDKRKEEGTLFEEEIAVERGRNSEENLSSEVEKQKAAMKAKIEGMVPPCPQCGEKMKYIPEQQIVACEPCGVGMRVG